MRKLLLGLLLGLLGLCSAFAMLPARAQTYYPVPHVPANQFLAGPTSGIPAIAAPRAMVVGDIPGYVVPNAFGGNVAAADGAGIAKGHAVGFLDENVIFSGNGVFPFQVDSTNPYVVGIGGTIASSTPGQTFRITVTATLLAGSPVTTASYVAIGGDTVSTIATALCAQVNGNTLLNNGINSLPMFCQTTGSGNFNLQWNVVLSDLAVTNAGTGSITLPAPTRTLDFARAVIGRNIPGYIGQSGDAIGCLSILGQSTSGAMDAVIGNMCGTLINAGPGAITGQIVFTNSLASDGVPEFAIQNGIALYDSNKALAAGGFTGRGRLNVPSLGGYDLAGAAVVNASGLFPPGSQIFGGTLNGSVLSLIDTSSGSPAGRVKITAGGNQGYQFDGTNSTFGVAGSVVGRAAFANLTSGTITLVPPTGALGAAVLTLPDATDTIVGKTTTDTLTNKTFDTAATGNSLLINGLAATANTGTGAVARAASPTFTAPTLGAALATSINGLALTSSTGTLTVVNGKTFTANNSTALTSTDGVVLDFTGWSAFTPSPACGTATITTAGAGRRTLDKITLIHAEFTITALGTCTNAITFTLPVAANVVAASFSVMEANRNLVGACRPTGGAPTSTAQCILNGAAAFAVNDDLRFSGVYENQ